MFSKNQYEIMKVSLKSGEIQTFEKGTLYIYFTYIITIFFFKCPFAEMELQFYTIRLNKKLLIFFHFQNLCLGHRSGAQGLLSGLCSWSFLVSSVDHLGAKKKTKKFKNCCIYLFILVWELYPAPGLLASGKQEHFVP